jgi:hypothetical protein
MVNNSIVYLRKLLRSIGCILFELITLEKYFNNQSFFYLENTTEDLNELLKMLFNLRKILTNRVFNFIYFQKDVA